MSGCCLSTWIIHALSLPDDHEIKHLVIWSFGHLVSWLLDLVLVMDLLMLAAPFRGVDMSELSTALKERTITFALNVLRLVDRFPQTAAAKVIAYQLAKS